jgi:hypothetical protein
MPTGFAAPRKYLQRKPPHGSPCTRCGLCCLGELCDLGQKLFGHKNGPCPALHYDENDNSVCGVVFNPQLFTDMPEWTIELMRESAALLLNSGMGCDMRINGEKPNQAHYDKCDAFEREHRIEITFARQLWGMQ